MDKLIGYEQEIKSGNILSVQINLLNRCTSKCKSCRKYTWPDDELPIEDLKETIYVLKNMGLKTIVLSGGEPLLYKHIKELIYYIYDLGLKCSIITTCITSDEELINILSSPKMYRIHISLDACDIYNYKYIRGVDAFDIVDRNIKIINSKRVEQGLIPIRFSTTVSGMNYKFVKYIYDYAKRHKCTVNYYLVHTFDNLKLTNVKDKFIFYNTILNEIVLDENLKGSVISNARDLIIDYKYRLPHKVNCRCFIPSISCVINANGDIYPCCRLMNDNGEYNDEHKRYVIGNIIGKDCEELYGIFINTNYYPLDCEECKECGQRYYDMIEHLNKIMMGRKDVLFI